MPIKKYFSGHGEDVMSDMQNRYGAKKGKSVFYATANKKAQKPETTVGSLEDVTFHENAAKTEKLCPEFTHPIHKGYDDVVWGELDPPAVDGDVPQFTPGKQSCNRDTGQGLHYGAPVDYFGPDTDYRAEEINVHHYGADYDPMPFRDFYKDEKKGPEENLIRLIEEYKWSETDTPGVVQDKGLTSSMAYGSISYEKVPVELPDRRSFKEQQRFRRAQDERDEDTPKVAGLDTKKGKNIR